MIRLVQASCLIIVLTCADWAWAEPLTAEIEAVAARAESYRAAFNRHDVDACAAHWSETAEYVLAGSGQRIKGRQAIRAALKQLLATAERFELSVFEQRFRPISPDVVIEEGIAELVSASHGLERAGYLVVHARKDGNWYRDSVHETVIPTSAQSESQLDELSWLIGPWQRDDEHGSVQVHGEWINNKRFISRSFKIRAADYKLDGTQIIGWDPSAGVIRSWSFDSEGGHEQAMWTRDGESWLVKVNAVLPDGSTGSEQRVLTRESDRKFTSEIIEQQVDGRLLPGVAKTTLVRVSAK